MKLSHAALGVTTGFTLIFTLSACGETNDEQPMSDETMEEDSTPMDEESTDEADDDNDDEDDGHDDHDSDSEDQSESGQDGEAFSEVMPEGTGDPFTDVRTAAEHMPMTGETFAVAFSEALGIEGDPTSEAAQVRSELTALFQEHVYLAGIAVATAYQSGPDSMEFELAAEAVDANSVALADSVGELADEDARESFLRNWREHIDYFVDYALAAEAGDDAGMEQAVDDLREYTEGVGLFFERTTDGELDADTVTESFNGHVDTLAAAVDSLAAGEADAFSNLKMAADHVVEGSAVMADGLAAAAGLAGETADDATDLRAALTANLNEHVYLAGIAVFVAYTDEEGTDSEAFAAAADVVDDNAVELADAIGELAGEENREPFLDLWRDHIGYFVDYAEAVAVDDDSAAEQALMDLDQYRYDAGDFFDEVSAGELPAQDVAEGLAMHVRTLAGSIDSLNEALVQND